MVESTKKTKSQATKSAIAKEVSHSYGYNQFQLYGLPIPRLSKVLGLVGQTGKSTALQILAGLL